MTLLRKRSTENTTELRVSVLAWPVFW